MMAELEAIETQVPDISYSAAEVKARSQLIQQVMDALMVVNTHYGTIPGTSKPTLYKAGADQLAVTFKMAASYNIEDLSSQDEIRYRITCNLNHHDGTFLGSGVGEASTNEEKYKWENTYIKAEWDEAPGDRKRRKWKQGKGSNKDYQVDQLRTEPSDKANTVLKMAKKRAHIDATLTATGASDIFAQDLEDMSGIETTPEAEATNKDVKEKTISEKQEGRLHAIRKAKGLSEEAVKKNLAQKWDYKGELDKLPVTTYNELCDGMNKMDDKGTVKVTETPPEEGSETINLEEDIEF